MKVIIIGGVAGGATCAARLRRLDEHAQIIMVERGQYISFANCGLPYFVSGEIEDRDELELQTPESFGKRFNVDVRVLTEAIQIDREGKTVELKNVVTGEVTHESYDKLVLSPGAEPVRPRFPGSGLPGVFTVRTIPDALGIEQYLRERAPKSAVVAGGGFIGLEMAEGFVRRGMRVTIAEAGSQVLAPFDRDMASEVHAHIRKSGADLRLNAAVEEISQCADGTLDVKIGGQTVNAGLVILSVGVRPESALARAAGLDVSERGFIVTDSHMRTSDADIFAAGDAVETTDFVTGARASFALAGPANKQGRIAADNICGINTQYPGAQGSAVVRVFGMTAAATGINEKAARALGINYDKVFVYPPSHAGYYPGGSNMMIKAIFSPSDGRILGAQITGFDGVDKRCDVLATAIRAKMTARELTELELCYAPPYGSAKDAVNILGYAVENQLSGLVKAFHWHDVASLDVRECNLIDVRTRVEFARGYIDGFTNIPLDDLRERLNELDRSKPVYVTCQVGQRGYLASCILTQNGFDAYNLSGGYRLYSCVAGN